MRDQIPKFNFLLWIIGYCSLCFVSLLLAYLAYHYLGFEHFLELLKVVAWPVIVVIGMLAFRKVVTYLFFSLEEFNFFGARGKLKGVQTLIEERAQAKLLKAKEDEGLLQENFELKTRLEEAQGDPARLSDIAGQLLKQVEDLTTIIQDRNDLTPRIGKLVNKNGYVCYVGNGVLFGIPDLKTFNSWGYTFDQVVPANGAERALPQIGSIPMKLPNFNAPLEQMAISAKTENLRE